MNTLVYDRDKLVEAVNLLLDQRWGETRERVIRAYLKGNREYRSWFSQGRKPLRIFLDIAEQPTGMVRVLDLLDAVSRKRKELAKYEEENTPEVARLAKVRADCARHYRQRQSAAVLTEKIRRESVGEKPMTADDIKAYLKRRSEYWNRRTKELMDAAKLKAETRPVHAIRAEIADILLKEELNRLEKARAGLYKLSDASIRRVNSKYDKRRWRTATK